MKFCNITSFSILPTAEGVTHFEFGQRDSLPFCWDGHSDCVCASGGLGPPRDVPSLRSALSRRCGSEGLWMPRSVACDGVCSAHVSREPARLGVFAAFPHGAALSDGVSQRCAAKHARRCERSSRLAYLCGLGTEFDSSSAQALRHGAVRSGTRSNRVRARCDGHRLVPESVSLGSLSFDQGSDQIAYSLGSAWLDPDVSRSDRGCGTRGQQCSTRYRSSQVRFT